MPIQKLETTNVLKQWMDTINTIIDDSGELESRLNEKVDKETGKGLSTNDFTNTLKDKLDGIDEGANNYTLPTANNATKGGVTLSDSTSSESDTNDGIAATPKAVKSAYDLASKALPKAGGIIEGDLTVTGKINATIEGNTDSANKLSVARTIALTGDVSGSTTFDGSKDVSITVTVADDSHSHTIENIDNLETLLASKAGITSPTFIGIPKAPTANEGTNTTQIATTAFVQSAIDSKIAASDAMIFKGTIGTNGTVTSLPAEHSIGWTYKVSTVGVYAGLNCEVGDMIVCLADGNTANDADWTVIQTNIDGAVTGPASAIEDRIAVFSGTSGKIIKDSGYTISASVPADAKFTDTTYSAENGISLTGTTFSNSGVRSVSSGTANGTISVNTNGTSSDVAVKGLGSAAYTETTAYTEVAHKSVVASKDTNGHVKLSDDTNSDSGVENGVAATPAAVKSAYDLANAALPKTGGTITGDLIVTGKITASIEGVADSAISAEKLSNARAVALTGDVTGSATFDGSEDISISVTVADDSHSHTIENIDNLETLLASKAGITSPTFTGTPKAPTANEGTNNTQIATTAFVSTAVTNAVDGVVYGPETSSVGNIAIFNDANGNSVSDSGFTIASSVPADAKFTDTTYNVGSADKAGITKLYTETGDNTDGTINQDVLTTLFEGKLGVEDTAVRATSDDSGNVITITYATKEELSNIVDRLADVATSGSYNDLSDKPTSLKNPTSLTFQNSNGTSIGSYDGSTATTVKLDASTVGLGNVTNESKTTMFTSPAFSGTPTAPTATAGTNNTQIATTAFVSNAIAELVDTAPETLNTLGEIASAISENVGVTNALNEAIATKAPLASPAFTGTPTAPTATAGTNTTQVATTAFVITAINNKATSDASTYATKTELNTTNTEVAKKANDSDVVKLSGEQTIKGVKIFSSTISGSIDGNAGSADKLKTARTINGVSFDGSADINVREMWGADERNVATAPNEYYRKGGMFRYTGIKGRNTIGLGEGAGAYQAVLGFSGWQDTSGGQCHELAFDGTNNIIRYRTGNGSSSSDWGAWEQILTTSSGTAVKASTADKLTTARTIALTGDVSGSASFDGSAPVSITATVADNSHAHTIENISNLETLLAGKSNIASPAFTGTPTAPTATAGTNTTQVATTAFVNTTVSSKVSGPASSVANNVAIFDGATGKVIKDSGFTIGKSVPSNAEFTDNSVTQTSTVDNANYPVIMKYIANNINSTEGVRYATNVTINPSTGNITASTFTGSLDGTAERAISDSIGNVITDTYATKTELSELDESLSTVATSGSYNDLSDKPTSLKNPTSLTIQNSAGTSITAYDGSTAKTVKLDASTVGLGNVTNESKATMFTSPAFTGTPTAPTASSTTSNTQIATTAFVQSVVDSKIAAADAMIYKGTIGTNGTVTALPNTHKTGWTYKVVTAGVYAGVKCNVGDMIICLVDGTSANNAHWSVIEGNIDGAVTGPAFSVANNVAIFDGATGKIIKDSGFSIAKSVPSDAKFTDTTYSQATTSNLGLVKLTDTLSSSGVTTGVAATPQLVNSALNNYYTKTQIDDFVNDLRVDDVTGSEYIMTLTSGYSANHVYELGTFTYPRGMDAVRVSLDGFTLSKGIHYEEVQSSSTSIYSNQIKLLVDTEAEMVLHIWVAPIALQVSALEDRVIAAQGYAEIAQEVGDRLGSVGASVFPFKGSTTTTVGTEGLVPKPAAGNSERYLNCEGTWKELNTVVGATATTHGTAGLVPAPMKGEESLFLRGDGTWHEVVVEGVDNLLSKSGGEMSGNLITKGVFGVVARLSDSNINLSMASTFTKTITSDTTFTISGVPASTSAVFTLVLTNGGNHVVTYPTNMKWASGEVPTLTADGVDILTFITVDGGNTWYGSPSIINANPAVI